MKIRPLVDRVAASVGYKIIKLPKSAESKQQDITLPLNSACFLEPASNGPSAWCTSNEWSEIPPGLDPWVADAASQFKEKGVCVISTDAKNAARWREAIVFDNDVGNKHPDWEWAGNPIVPYSSPIKTATPDSSLLEELKKLFSSKEFDAFFHGIMGCGVTIANCRLVQSVPHESEGVGPQSWHRDGTPVGVIRGVLYLTDVDEKSGPFEYKGTDGQINTVLGQVGDCLIFDAQRAEHRAMPPKEKCRMAVDLAFLPRLANQKLDVIHAGMNHWPADPFFFKAPEKKFQDYTSLGLSSVEKLY